MKTLLIFILAIGLNQNLVEWSHSSKKVKNGIELTFEGDIENNWIVYSSKLKVDGPLPCVITWDKSDDFEVIGELEGLKPKRKFDKVWEGNIDYFDEKATFKQKIKILKPNTKVSGVMRYQACIDNPEDGRCINEEHPFTFQF